jgi:hypothetical protein
MPLNKITVSVISYGRSFKIAKAGYYIEMYLFTSL